LLPAWLNDKGVAMTDIEVVMVCFPNHPARVEYLRRTWDTIQRYMTASKHNLRFVCSSESERDPTCKWCGDELERFCDDNHMPLHWATGPASLGHGMNAAIRAAKSDSFVIHQDDYELLDHLDLSPGAIMMESHKEVDLIRYGYPPKDFGWRLLNHAEGWLKFDVKSPWPYGDEPHMQRKDFTDRHGWYQEHGGHASEGAMLRRLVNDDAVILAADKRYYGHFGSVSAVPAIKEVMKGRTSKR
jgi:hypothetical protein